MSTSAKPPNRLRAIREREGLSLSRLCKRMDLSPKSKTYLSQIERGDVIPHGITREKIARALGVKREEIWPEDAEAVA